MFDSLLGGKFSNRSKHAIKCIKSRVVPIRKKKQAMLGFLRKDIADLLAHGHDTNAFGRIDELIADINRTSCYDMIDQYCGCILKQLPNLQKQRECPQEAMEAMSTLIFAAARFPKLPELCDLRRVFTERYGSHMESSVNAEFVEKSQKETFSIEEKLHLMQEIAKEYCINWDSKKFGTKISSPALTSDKPRKSPSMTNGDDELSHKLPNGRHRTAVDVPYEEMPPKERHEPTLRNTMQKLQIEPIDIPVISSVNNGHVRDSSKKTKKFADEPENVKPCYDDTALPFSDKSKDRQNGTHKDDVNEGFTYDKSSRAQEVRNHKGLEKQTNGSIQSLNDKAAYRVPPYTKSKGSMNGTQAEEQHDDGLAHHRFSRAEEGLDPISVERRPVRPINMNNDGASKLIPPYVKPKVSSVADPIDLFNQVNTSNEDPAGAGYGMSNGCKDNLRDDLFGDDGKPKPRSVKSKYTKVPVVDDVDAIDGDKLLNGIPGSRRTGGRQITGNQIDDYTEQKIMGQRSRARASVEVDNVIDYGKLLIQTPRGRRGQQGSRRNAAAYDGDCEEEEKIMDHLLTHYSKKGLPCKPSKARTMTRTPPTEQVFSGVEVSEHQRNNKHNPCPRETVYQRAVSLPPKPISLAEVVKGPACATSMQPDLLSPNMGRVHPRLPDYDELASRLIALRKA